MISPENDEIFTEACFIFICALEWSYDEWLLFLQRRNMTQFWRLFSQPKMKEQYETIHSLFKNFSSRNDLNFNNRLSKYFSKNQIHSLFFKLDLDFDEIKTHFPNDIENQIILAEIKKFQPHNSVQFLMHMQILLILFISSFYSIYFFLFLIR